MAHTEQIITSRHLAWSGFIFFCIAVALASVFVNAIFIVAGVILLVNVFLILKYPMWGLLSYLIIFLLRPGEMFPALAPLRLELLTGLFVALALVLNQRFREGRLKLPKDKITLSLVAFLAVLCMTIFVSYGKSITAERIQDFIKLLIFYYLIVSIIDTKKKLVAFVVTYLMLIAYIAFDAFRLYLAGGFIHTMNVDRMSGTTSAGGDPNSLANTLAATIPFVVASAMYFRNFITKILLWTLAISLGALITVTASRGGLVAFLGVIIGAIYFSRRKLLYVAMVAVLLLAGWAVLPEQYKARYSTMTDLENLDQTSSGRWDIWENGINMIISQPFLGVGAGAFVWANGSGDFGPAMFMQAHNLYIQLTATTGFIGLAVWSIFMYFFIGDLIRLRRRVLFSKEDRWIKIYATSFLISLVALFISGMFAHSLYRYTWYVMAGLTAVMANLATKRSIEATDELTDGTGEPVSAERGS